MSQQSSRNPSLSTNFTEMSKGNVYLDGWGNAIAGSYPEGQTISNNGRSSGGYLNLHRTQSAQSSFSQMSNNFGGQNQPLSNGTASRPRSEAFFQHPGTNIRAKSLPYVEGEQQEELGKKFGIGTLWPVQDAIYKGYQRRASPSPIGERPQAISAPVVPLSPTLFPWNNPELPPKQQENNNINLRNGHHREVILGNRIRPHTFGEETAKNTSYSLFGNQGNHPLDSLPISPTREDRSSSSGSGSHDGDEIDLRYSSRENTSSDHATMKTIHEDEESYGGIRFISDPNNFSQGFLSDGSNLTDGENIVRAPSADSIGSNGSFSPNSIPFEPATPYGEHPLGEHPSRTLFVRNINSNVEDDELVQLFEAHGQIRSMYTQCKHRGFVMISYYDIRHAKNAMRHLQGKPLRRRKLDIHYSIPKDNPSEKDQNQGTLVIFNLDPSTSNEELKSIFGSLGEIKEIRETPNKKHHKFIEFYDVRDAEKAMKHLNKTEVKGKKIKIEPSRPGGARKTNGSNQNDYFSQIEDEYSSMGLGANHYSSNSDGSDFSESEQSNYFQHFPASVVPVIQEKQVFNVPVTSSISRFSSPPITPLPASSALSAPFSPSAATLNAMANNTSFPTLQSSYPNSSVQGISFNSSATNTNISIVSPIQTIRPRSSSGNPPLPANNSIWISPEPLRAPSVSAPPFRQINSPTITQKENTETNAKPIEKDTKPNRVRAESLEDRSKYTLNLSRVSDDTRTTLMIRNIPNKYTQKMLLQAVDEHHKGCYDFFYLPIDFKNKCNVGYAFINFTSPSHIVTFYEEFNNKKWEKFNSEKVCELTYARIQGKIALIGHFQNSSLMCEDKKCRPIIFNLGEQEPFPVGNSIKRRAMSVGGKDDEAILRQLNMNG